MPENNLASVVFTTEELKKIDDALAVIEEVIKDKTLKLSKEERRQYGSIAESNKLFVNKSKEMMEQYPQYLPAFIDKAEFDRDYQSRTVIETRLVRLQAVTEQLSDTKILLDHDNYHTALSFYRNIRYLVKENVPGIKTIFEELKQFFGGGRPKKTEKNSQQ